MMLASEDRSFHNMPFSRNAQMVTVRIDVAAAPCRGVAVEMGEPSVLGYGWGHAQLRGGMLALAQGGNVYMRPVGADGPAEVFHCADHETFSLTDEGWRAMSAQGQVLERRVTCGTA